MPFYSDGCHCCFMNLLKNGHHDKTQPVCFIIIYACPSFCPSSLMWPSSRETYAKSTQNNWNKAGVVGKGVRFRTTLYIIARFKEVVSVLPKSQPNISRRCLNQKLTPISAPVDLTQHTPTCNTAGQQFTGVSLNILHWKGMGIHGWIAT